MKKIKYPIPCPVCGGTEYRESWMCPMREGIAVCRDCCLSCEFHKKGFGNGCAYALYHPRKDYSVEIGQIVDEIEKLEDELRHERNKVPYFKRKKLFLAANKSEVRIRELELKLSKKTKEKERLINER